MARIELDARWRNHACLLALTIGLLVSFLRWSWSVYSDPLHCVALVTQGQWIGPHRTNWQPQGCMLHTYTSKDASTCFKDRSSIFIGDSITRTLFFSFIHLLDPSLPDAVPANGDRHADYHYISAQGSDLSFFWDPFLNSSNTKNLLGPTSPTSPYLVILGSGLWYLRYHESSGGLAQWQTNTRDILKSISTRSPSEHLILLPIEKLVHSKLSQERAETMRTADIDAMNAELKNQLSLFTPRSTVDGNTSYPVIFPSVFNDLLDPSETEDGLHYSKPTVLQQANILLNRICNDILPKTYPIDKTCCRAYPRPSGPQIFFLVVIGFLGPAVLFLRRVKVMPSVIDDTQSPIPAWHIAVIGGCAVLLYLADRSHLFSKEQKQFEPVLFTAALLLTLAVGLLRLETGKDQSFLNRKQTDEWKGWMQIIILIYHYLGASKISGIYNPIRVLVASYLFMTGYGHCSFYLKKADFGFLRVAQVLTRLNLLTLVLAYAMNTSYFDYYFAPMVSFWFLVIYVTMLCGARFNDNDWILIGKLVASGVIVQGFINTPFLFDNFLQLLRSYANISWSKKEVLFRLNLDLWIVYVGMLCAVLFRRIKATKMADQEHWHTVRLAGMSLSAFGLCWFMYFQLSQPSKFTYNKWHPLISWIPILSFIILRNATSRLRATWSTVYAFVGTCSLETFIIQFHFWLAADTKGILLMLPGTTWRPLNVVLTTTSFVWISHQVAGSTTHLTDWICGVFKEQLPHTSSPSPLVDQNGSCPPSELEARNGELCTRNWLDRLANNRPSIADGKRWNVGLGMRFAILTLCLWFLNLIWPS